MFEPLLFFIFPLEYNISAIPLSVSRILQIIVLYLIIIRFILQIINKNKIIIKNNFFENKYLILFLILLIFSGIIGFINNSYVAYSGLNGEVNLFDQNYPHTSRILLEHVILLFNIFYFVILSRYLLKSKVDFDYLFRIFKFFLITCLLLGYLDYLFYKFVGLDLIGRHLRDGIDVGGRFHGLGGEPRQAFVQIVFYISMYILYCDYFKISLNKKILLLLLCSLLLTESTSSLFALIFFTFFLIFYNVINYKYFLITILIIFLILQNDRVIIYLLNIENAFQIINSGDELPYSLRIIRREIYPIYDMIIKFQNFELISIIFGNGLGTSSIINNFYTLQFSGVGNPNVQIVRFLYENGLLGTFIFVISMIFPIKYYSRHYDKNKKKKYLIMVILILSAFMAVRSSLIFVFLGVLTSYLCYQEKIKN